MKIKNPFNRTTEPINYDIYERFIQNFDFHSISSQIFEDVKHQIEQNLREMKPDLLVNFVDTYKQITSMMKEFEKTIKYIENKTKKLFESSSLAEDVFKMRDEMKVLKKKLDKLNSGLKGLSKLSNVFEEGE